MKYIFVFIEKVKSSDTKSPEHIKHRVQGHVTVKRKDGSVWWVNKMEQTETMDILDKISGQSGSTAELLTRIFSF